MVFLCMVSYAIVTRSPNIGDIYIYISIIDYRQLAESYLTRPDESYLYVAVVTFMGSQKKRCTIC